MSDFDLTEAEVEALLFLADDDWQLEGINPRFPALIRAGLAYVLPKSRMTELSRVALTPTGRALVERLEGER